MRLVPKNYTLVFRRLMDLSVEQYLFRNENLRLSQNRV